MNKIKDAWNHQEEIIICNCNREGIHKIAKKFNCNHWVIYRILESNGIKPLGRKTSFNQRFNKEKAKSQQANSPSKLNFGLL